MEQKWWHDAVVYQIYPRSFKDSNGDGIGDLRGIVEKLDYLKDLGIDIIWLSPVYKSPMDDNGYDISDYRAIAPEFGTMEDMETLIKAANQRGIKIMMDLVVNHTSDEHPWFIESSSSLNNSKRDWYIWKKGKADEPPNNWGSYFSRSAWEKSKQTDEYYLHLFSIKQPDLNWENIEVRNAVYEMMHWWLKKGIGGFRMDVINMLSKPSDFPDATKQDSIPGYEYWVNGPKIHEYLKEMHREVLSKYNIVTVGEMPFVDEEDGILYTSDDRQELDMIFHFEHMSIDKLDGDTYNRVLFKLSDLKKIFSRWQKKLYRKGWNSLYWNNHDQARVVSRFGDDGIYRIQSAKMLATTLHFMQGTPYIYQGEEIGMTNVIYEDIDDYNDIWAHHYYDVATKDQGLSHEEAMKNIYANGRDNARTPIQWSAKEYAGFSKVKPWLKVNENYRYINVEETLKNKNSIFHYYKKLIALRKSTSYKDVIVYGEYDDIDIEDESVFWYTRSLNDVKLLIVSNFTNEIIDREFNYDVKDILISNYESINIESNTIKLQPYEVVVFSLK